MTRAAEDHESNGVGDPCAYGAQGLLDCGATSELPAESAPGDGAFAEHLGDGSWDSPLSEVVTDSARLKQKGDFFLSSMGAWGAKSLKPSYVMGSWPGAHSFYPSWL